MYKDNTLVINTLVYISRTQLICDAQYKPVLPKIMFCWPGGPIIMQPLPDRTDRFQQKLKNYEEVKIVKK